MLYIDIDTREHQDKNNHILDYFMAHKISFRYCTLPTGDYRLFNDNRILIDRKKDIMEIAGNIMNSEEHVRFRNELIRAKEQNSKLYILIQDEYIYNIDGVKYFKIPTFKSNQYKTINGINVLVKRKGQPRANFKPEILAKCMKTMEEKYGCKFVFCKKEDTAKKILKLLGVDING